STSRELGWLLRRVLTGAAFVIANSRNTVRLLREEWQQPAQRVHLLYPGVDTSRFVPAARDLNVLARLGWGNRTGLLTVRRLQKRKGHDQMILALHAIRKSVPDVLYVIVGEGEEQIALRNLVAAEGLSSSVQFLGELDDESLVRCYQQCDLFVLPNRQVDKD